MQILPSAPVRTIVWIPTKLVLPYGSVHLYEISSDFFFQEKNCAGKNSCLCPFGKDCTAAPKFFSSCNQKNYCYLPRFPAKTLVPHCFFL